MQVGSWHPTTYPPGQIKAELINGMRMSRVPHDNWTDCTFGGWVGGWVGC